MQHFVAFEKIEDLNLNLISNKKSREDDDQACNFVSLMQNYCSTKYTNCYHVGELNMILDSLSWAVMSDKLIDIVIANSLATTHSAVHSCQAHSQFARTHPLTRSDFMLVVVTVVASLPEDCSPKLTQSWSKFKRKRWLLSDCLKKRSSLRIIPII